MKIFKPVVNSESVFNKDGLAIQDIKNIKNTDALLVTYKDGSQEIFENYRYFIDHVGYKDDFNPYLFETVDILENTINPSIGEIVYYNNDFIVVDENLLSTISALYEPKIDFFDDGSEVYFFNFINKTFNELIKNIGILKGEAKFTDNFIYDLPGLNFDGSNCVYPNYELLSDVACSSISTSCPGFSSGVRSFSAWIKLDSGTDFVLYNTGARYNGFGIGIKDNKPYLTTQNNDKNNFIYGNTNINSGEIHHFVYILDADNMKVKIYIDGKLDIETSISIYPGSRSSYQQIGSAEISNTFYDSSPKYTYGTINIFRIFNRDLSDEEVRALFNEIPLLKKLAL